MNQSETATISTQPRSNSLYVGPTGLTSEFAIGGVAVRLCGKSPSDITLNPLLQPFRVDACAPNINIRVEWRDRIPPPSGEKTFDSGTTWKLHRTAQQLEFDLQSEMLGLYPYARLAIDDGFSQGTLQMSEECFAYLSYAAEPLGYPLDELLIMHRLTQERAIELHGVGIVGPDGASNLFVGHSGAGKSTTARLWTSLHKVDILSDDRIIVREHPVRQHPIREHPGHQSNPTDAATQIYMYGTPWHGEAHFALPQRAPLQRIFVLEHGHGNVLTRLSRSQMVAELFARAFVPFHRHEYVDHALAFLERVADSVPCYHYSFEPDERAVEKVLHFRD